MSLNDKIKRLKEGLDAEQDPDLIQSTKAIIQGMTFYHLGIGTELAQKRWDDHCKVSIRTVDTALALLQQEAKPKKKNAGKTA